MERNRQPHKCKLPVGPKCHTRPDRRDGRRRMPPTARSGSGRSAGRGGRGGNPSKDRNRNFERARDTGFGGPGETPPPHANPIHRKRPPPHFQLPPLSARLSAFLAPLLPSAHPLQRTTTALRRRHRRRAQRSSPQPIWLSPYGQRSNRCIPIARRNPNRSETNTITRHLAKEIEVARKATLVVKAAESSAHASMWPFSLPQLKPGQHPFSNVYIYFGAIFVSVATCRRPAGESRERAQLERPTAAAQRARGGKHAAGSAYASSSSPPRAPARGQCRQWPSRA